MAEHLEAKPVYYHDCPALGKNAKVIESTMLDNKNEVVLFRQNKCPFCSQKAGGRRYANGVRENIDGSFTVDMNLAERVG